MATKVMVITRISKELVALLWSKGKLIREITVKRFMPRIKIFDPEEQSAPIEFDAPNENDLSKFCVPKILEFINTHNIREELHMITCDYEEVV